METTSEDYRFILERVANASVYDEAIRIINGIITHESERNSKKIDDIEAIIKSVRECEFD